MGGLVPALTQETLDNQREVVKNERRQRYENVPYGDAWLRLLPLLYPPGHPYHHSTIGSMEDLNAAGLATFQAFHHSYYAPNNAVLTVAGDASPEQVYELAEKYFGVIEPVSGDPGGAVRAPDRTGHRAGPRDGDRQGAGAAGLPVAPDVPVRHGPRTTRSPCWPRCSATAAAAGCTSGSPTAAGSPSPTTSGRTAWTWRTPQRR